MVKLIIEDDEGKTTVVPLIRDEITIGRKEGNTIRLTERNVSRRHAKLLKQNGAIFIEDLGSYNGIKVNGNKILGRIAVTEGDRIQIGDYILGLKLEASGLVEEEDAFAAAKTMEIQRIPDEELAKVPELAGAEPAPAPSVPAPAPEPQKFARLVCVSTNFAAKEWWLDKPIVVLGRTEDNDIVINHRSISRHHARFTLEGSRYTILDLKSANGVRVNGEEYGKVELRRGDLVDLGHVRLRFVAPGEDFDFARDATVVDISKPSSSRGLLLALLSGLAVLVVGLVIWRLVTPTPQPGPNASVNPTSPTPDAAAVVAAKPSPDAGASQTVPATDQLLARIHQSVVSEQWDEAIKDCQKISVDQKDKAREDCQKAELEKAAYQMFEQFNSAATKNDFYEAVRFHNQIPTDSIYKKRDLKIYNDAKEKYLAQALKELEELVRKRECDQARSLAAKIKEVSPGDTAAEAQVQRCSEAVVAARVPKEVEDPGEKIAAKPPVIRKVKPTPAAPTANTEPASKKPTPPVQPASTGPSMEDMETAKTLLMDARSAYVSGKYDRSMSLSKQVLKLNPGQPFAIKIIGASACFLKNVDDAQWAFGKLNTADRNALRNICLKNGITLGDDSD